MSRESQAELMRLGLVVGLAIVLLTAGCFGVTPPEHSPTPEPSDTPPNSPRDSETTVTTESLTQGPSETPPETETSSPTDTPVPNPPSDRLGWEDGYWHNDSVSVDRSDGLNDSELNAVVSRAMARVEQIRRVEFNETVPVTVISRAEYRADFVGRNHSSANRLHQNTKWEATFVVGESSDALTVQQSNRGSSVLGFYSPSRNEIVLVSDNTDSPDVNEFTLAHELVHALQDQAFDAFEQDWYPGRTVESNNAVSSVIEGDANYVEHHYTQRCDEEWNCLSPQGGAGGSGDINVGMFAVSFHPYSDGPVFIQRFHERSGWEAVNELYSDPPASTEQVIHPEKYGVDEPDMPTIDHSASNGWRVLEMGEDSVNYASFGEAGLAVMLWYPSFATRSNVIVNLRDFYNIVPGTNQLQPIGPYNYTFEPTAGWDGDRLVPYVNDGSYETNETGYVWKSNWDSTEDASAFVAAYESLLTFHDGEAVTDRVYRIPDENEFGDAFSISQEGDTVTIVNAPTIDQLDDVHDGAGPRD